MSKNSTSKEQSFLDKLEFGYIPGKYFIPSLIILILGVMFDAIPKGFLGGFVICAVFGLFLIKIGDSTPIVDKYLGGGSCVVIFGAAALMYLNVFPENLSKMISDFVKGMDYIGLIVSSLICGSILSMNRNMLIRVGSLYFFPLIGGVLCAFLFGGVLGEVIGYGWREAILFISLPIMGGGTSAGAVPTSIIYASNMQNDGAYYLSLIMPAVVIGNALSVIAAGFLHSIGEKYPNLTGKGKMMKTSSAAEDNKREDKPITASRLGRGWVFTGLFFVVGMLISKVIPGLHYYAWTILSCTACKIFNLLPEDVEEDIYQWYVVLMKVGVPGVLFAIGYVYTDLSIVIANMSLGYFSLVTITVIGGIIGAWIVGLMLGFYPIEIAITAGLCMSNMGGTGDIATLGASHRMELMPFAQISSRLGGALVLVVASILVQLIGVGL